MKLACKSWADNPLPYGSEFSWDSTGQEEAYIWGRYFNQSHLADTVLNAILAYDPSIPSWCDPHTVVPADLVSYALPWLTFG